MIKIYGSSDDLIEIEGDFVEEFNFISDDEGEKFYLGFSDGTVLSVNYDSDGIWRINRIMKGSAKYLKREAAPTNSVDYSDEVEIDGDIKWILSGKNILK